MKTGTANWVITSTLKLKPELVHKLLGGESVLVRTGTNLMGETLCVKIQPKRQP